MRKYNGIVLLGLCAADTSIFKLFLYRSNNWAIWTLNDFWNFYPDLRPDRAYKMHDSPVHVDELGNKRDVSCFTEYCKKIQVPEVIQDLSVGEFMRYYGQQPRQWYQSSINYMFVDAWNLIESGAVAPNMALEGMPFIGPGERQNQRSFVQSAVEMSIIRGIKINAPHYQEWCDTDKGIDWNSLADVETYAINQRQHAVMLQVIKDEIKSFKDDKLFHMRGDVFKGSDPSDEDIWRHRWPEQ